MNQSENKVSKENSRQGFSLPDYEREPAEPRIIHLCRQYVTLSVGAVIIFLLNISLNTWVYSSYINTALGLLIVAGAVYYGLRIAEQARLDALRNKKSLEDAHQKTLETAALYDTTRDISESRELTPLFDTILDRMSSLLDVSGGAIFLYDAEHNDLQIAAETGVGMPIGTRLSVNEGLGGQVVKTRAPLIVNDYMNWENRADSLRELPIRATVCVPMIRNNELIGVLGAHEFAGEPKRRIFTDADARLLSFFADNAAVAVHNARLMEKLRHSEERFRIAAECASDLVYERDLISDTARFFSPQTNRSEFPSDTKEFYDSIHPEDRERVMTALQNHLKTGVPFSEEYRISDAQGGCTTILDRAVTILDRDGKPIRLVGSISDITERKHAEQVKSDFISFVTHQLRTPLSGIKWMLELAIDANDNQDEMRSFIADARLSTERLIRLVNDLLDASRLEQGRQKVAAQPVDLEKLTHDAVAEMSPALLEMKQALTIEVVNSLPYPKADRPQMRQAIINLLSNSVKYTPVEGRIDIRISAEQDSVRWEINDTGIGIPKNDHEKLFEKFYRADNVPAVETEGTGLGLYLVRLIIERFGGRVWCEPKEGAGAKFIFSLPVCSGSAD